MEMLVYLFAIFGLAFFFKESDGPFDLMARFRNFLLMRERLGVFFYKLLSCYFCVGCHAGWIVYLLQAQTYSVNLFVLWTLAGGTVSLILDKLLTKLTPNNEILF